jgi:hypothetical protein
MPVARTRKRYNVTPEVFVRTWQSSVSTVEAARRLGMPRNTLLARASRYRSKLGVKLKKLEPSPLPKLDAEYLRRVAAEAAE